MSNEIKSKERKVFLGDLPRYEGSNGKINWNESVGHSFKYLYNGNIYDLEIIGYENNKKRYLTIKWNDTIFDIYTSSLKKCAFGNFLGIKSSEFKVDIGEVFKNNNRNIIITDREYRSNKNYDKWKWYKYTCKVCNWTEGWIEESDLLTRKSGCTCCSGRTVVNGINDIVTTRPDLIKYFKDINDTFCFTTSSNQKTNFVCPDCKTEKYIKVSNISHRGFCCAVCGDRTSIPEKFISNVLKQLNVKFIPQLSRIDFKWVNAYRYDFYIPSLNMIIEAHGVQHYKNGGFNSRTLKEEQANDKLKKELALANGIKEENYIVIDCRYSELEWIKNSIMGSRLSEVFDLTNVNWDKSLEFALNYKISVEIRNRWNNKNPNETIKTISRDLCVHRDTVTNYLKLWSSLGYCDYNPNCSPIEICKNGISVYVYKSCAECGRESLNTIGVKLNHQGVSEACRTGKQYKGYTFRYITKEEYEQRKSQSA